MITITSVQSAHFTPKRLWGCTEALLPPSIPRPHMDGSEGGGWNAYVEASSQVVTLPSIHPSMARKGPDFVPAIVRSDSGN
jgi:hypothetical protein